MDWESCTDVNVVVRKFLGCAADAPPASVVGGTGTASAHHDTWHVVHLFVFRLQ